MAKLLLKSKNKTEAPSKVEPVAEVKTEVKTVAKPEKKIAVQYVRPVGPTEAVDIRIAFPPDTWVEYEQVKDSGNWMTTQVQLVTIGSNNTILYRMAGSLIYLPEERIRRASNG